MSLYGVGLNSEVKRIHLNMRLTISKKGMNLVDLRKCFRALDSNGCGTLSLSNFEQGLADFGLFTKVIELQALRKYYDKNCTG